MMRQTSFIDEIYRKGKVMSARIITPRHEESCTWYTLEFLSKKDPTGGFSFSCDENGIVNTNPIAYRNYIFCATKWRDKYQKPFVQKHTQYWTEDATAECEFCGKEFTLFDQYYGACQCDNCGHWYGMSGQSMRPPQYWGEETGEIF